MATTSAHIKNVTTESISTTPQRTNNFVQRLILRYKAKRQANKILKAIGEAEQIHGGGKQGKSYDQFLQEL